MKKIIFAIAIFLSLDFSCFSQEIMKVTKPREVTSEITGSSFTPKELEGLQWNRWTSKNFTVISLNDGQAQYLHKHLELVKVWCFSRWGLSDLDFSVECKVICVDNPDLFKKFFKINSTKVEVRRDANGKIKESVIFILIDGPPSQTVPIPLTEVCMAEFAQKYNTKLPMWFERGVPQLNGTIPQIKQRILELNSLLEKNEPMFFSKGLNDVDSNSYKKLDEKKKKLFDDCSLVFCLMVRKEFGQNSFLNLLKNCSETNGEEAIQKVLKFKGYSEFDVSFKRYIVDLTKDVNSGKTPDRYLQIE